MNTINSLEVFKNRLVVIRELLSRYETARRNLLYSGAHQRFELEKK